MDKFIDKISSRAFIVRVCKIGTMLSALALVTAFAVSAPFPLKLAIWFLFLLFLFHWRFGVARKLTMTHVRLIDYVYLGIAAFGVIILAVNYTQQREEYERAEYVDKILGHLKENRVRLLKSASDLERVSCEPRVVQMMRSYCERTKELNRAIQAETSDEKIASLIVEFRDSTTAPDSTDIIRSMTFRPIENQILDLDTSRLAVHSDNLSIEVHAPLPPDDIRDYSYGLFTWPFILTFAFALRITKTTIEVLDWAASKLTTSTG